MAASAAAAAAARTHAPVRSVSIPFKPPVLGPRKRVLYVRIAGHDSRHLSFVVDRMYRHARTCKDLRVHHPVPLPRQYKRWTILAGPFIDKKSREQYEIRTHTRLMVVEGDDRNVHKYLEFLKNEEIIGGVGVKVQDKAYYNIEDFFEPFEDDEPAIEREALAELAAWKKSSPAAEALKQSAKAIKKINGRAGVELLHKYDIECFDDPDDEELGLPENATKRAKKRGK